MLLRVPWGRSTVRRRRSWEPGVVGTSVWDFPLVGVQGSPSTGSLVEAKGAGAASDGKTGVEVWRLSGGVRFSGSLGWVHGFATREDMMSAETERTGFGGVTGSGITTMVGVDGRESSSR